MEKLKCVNISAREAGSLDTLPKGWVCISVNEEHRKHYDLKFDNDHNKKCILRLQFTDVTYKVDQGGEVYSPIDLDSVHKILHFAEFHKDKNFIVHCAAGISRSAAICMFLHVIYGHKLKKDFFFTSEPNPFALGLLISTYKRVEDLKKS